MKLHEKIYYSSPLILQNLMVSIYGLKLFHERYTENLSNWEDFLRNSELYSSIEIKNYQEKSFISIARHAISTVPYYRDWAHNEGICAQDIISTTNLKDFPVIGKEETRYRPERFISDNYRNSKRLIKLSTSGTTGKPITVFCDKLTRSKHYAFFTRLRKWYGLNSRSRRATFFGRMILLADQNKPPFWRYDLAQKNLLMSSYHLSTENLIHYYNKLVDYHPEEIIGYPSSVYQIAQYINSRGLAPVMPKLLVTTAETLLEYQRVAIEQAFQTKVVDQYGCTEMAFFAATCTHGTMHIHPEHGLIETIDHTGNPVIGLPGNSVVTGFINYVMPLIRYKIGDRLILASEGQTCACGSNFPIIHQVEGRIDDIIYRRDGTPVGRLDPVFKGGGHIHSSKIIQDDLGNIKVLVKPAEGFSDTEKIWLHNELLKRLGRDITINIAVVTDIPKDKNGKFKSVESHYLPKNAIHQVGKPCD